MGNTMELKLKQDKPVLEVTEALVGEFKECINMVDHSMAGLAKSMDAMRDACEMLLRQFDKDPQLQDATTGTDSEKVNSQQLVRHLLEMIDASVSDHKFVVMESLSKLLNFMWDVGKHYIDNTENSSLVFLVDKYKSDRNSVGIENGVSYADLRIRALQREKQILQDKYTSLERELKTLNEREVLYRQEIEVLENKTKAQKKKIEDLTEKQNSEVDGFDEITFHNNDSKEITALKKENNSLKQEYEQFKQNMIVAKSVTEECLNRKEQKMNELEQELQNLKIDTSRGMPSSVDEETSMEDFKGLTEETNMREEIDRLNQELTALKTYKVLHDKETSVEDFEWLAKETYTGEDIDRLTQEITALKTYESLKNDKETSMEDFEGLAKETYMREEIDRLTQEITALKTYKVLHCYEYEDKTWKTLYKKRIKEDLYEKLKNEMAVSSVNLGIFPWYPSNVIGIPTDKVILVPIFPGLYDNLNSKIRLILQEMNAGPNTVVLVFYDAEIELVCEEMKRPLLEEFNNFGGIFKFGHTSLKQIKTEINEHSFQELLQFLKSKCVEGRYLSR